MTQSSLGDFGGGIESEDEEPDPGSGYTRFEIAMKRAPDNAEPFADDSCPFCLAPAEDITPVEPVTEDGDVAISSPKPVSCDNCSAIVPIHAEWYQNGEKVCF